jgi:hypothetical protein
MPVTSFDNLPHVETKDRKKRKFFKRIPGVPSIEGPTLVDLFANGSYWLRRLKKGEVVEVKPEKAKDAVKKMEAPTVEMPIHPKAAKPKKKEK